MKILYDSFMVMTAEGNIFWGILFAFLATGGTILLLSKLLLTKGLTFSEYFSLSVGGTPFVLLAMAGLLILLSFLFKFTIEFLFFPVLVILCCLMLFVTRKEKEKQSHSINYSLLALILILAGSIYIRTAFISETIVPPYFDSAAHNSIVNNLMASYESQSVPSFVSVAGGYYHFGFHILIAVLSLVLHASVKDVILVFGQILLALIPLPLFFIVRQETGSDMAGLFAVLLAGWGWALPGHAVNWGKYPALTGILAFEFTLSTAYLVSQSHKRYKWIAITLCVLSICVSTFIHSRTLVLAGIAFVCSLPALRWGQLTRSLKNLMFLLVLGGVASLVILIRSDSALSLALDPYLQSGIWTSLAFLLLLPFACLAFPRGTFSWMLSILFLFDSVFIPLTNLVPGRPYQTLLDRPFVEIVLFFPLSVLGGLGIAGLIKTLHKTEFVGRVPVKLVSGFVILVLFGSIFGNAFTRYDFYPSACCQIFNESDAVAFDWMDKNLPHTATILIASFDLALREPSPSVVYAGSDAGIWLAPLIKRKTFTLPYDTNFDQDSTWAALHRHGISYIYVGRSAQSFRESELRNRPSFYKLVFSLSGVYVYEVVNVS
jgi:hypothetical protein